MKETVKTSRIAGELEKIYRALNADFFEGELVTPIITIQSTPRAYGHVTCSKVWKDRHDTTAQYELNLGAGTLNRPIENIVATMLHEMVHIYHLMHDIQDTSRFGVYHNKKFRDKAVSVGLLIEHDKNIGWSITNPSDDLILYIADKGWEDIKLYRDEGFRWTPPASTTGASSPAPTPAKAPKKPSSTRKYICPCCGMSVRATKTVNILCGDCKKIMIICA